VTDSASILIADNDATTARFLTRLLSREGHRVEVVTTAEAALERCASAPPDLVLVDLLAGGSWFEICRKIKEQESTRLIPVVIVTAQSDRADRLKGIEAGADDFVAKPFDLDDLVETLRRWLK
jgi:putative two-component system response regulator